MTEKDVFESFVNKEVDLMALKEDVKEIANKAKEAGFDGKAIGLIKKSAKLHVDNTFEEKEEATLELFEKYKELTGYDAPNPENAAKTTEFLKQNPEF